MAQRIPESVNPLIQFAAHMARHEIETTGGIHPWGAGLSSTGKMTVWRLPPGTPGMAVGDALGQIMATAAGDIEAGDVVSSAFVIDAKVRTPTGEVVDAATIFLECAEGAWTLHMSYTRQTGGEYTWGQLTAQTGERHFFEISMGAAISGSSTPPR